MAAMMCELCPARATRGTVCAGRYERLQAALSDHLSKAHGADALAALSPTGAELDPSCKACCRAARILASAGWRPQGDDWMRRPILAEEEVRNG